jgi:putative lipid kinase YegS-like protein
MPIAKGEAWGAPGSLPPGGEVVESDARARAVVEEARRSGRPVPALGLVGGDLCRTLGGRGDRHRLTSGSAMTFSVDLGAVLADGRLYWFVAHLVARTRWWGDAFVAMNAQWLGSWNLGPRAHPGDGLLDTYRGRLSVHDRVRVRARLHHGAHLPHPGIDQGRTQAVQVRFQRPRPLWLDGELVGRARHLSVRVEPDALTVVV